MLRAENLNWSMLSEVFSVNIITKDVFDVGVQRLLNWAALVGFDFIGSLLQYIQRLLIYFGVFQGSHRFDIVLGHHRLQKVVVVFVRIVITDDGTSILLNFVNAIFYICFARLNFVGVIMIEEIYRLGVNFRRGNYDLWIVSNFKFDQSVLCTR